MTETRDYDVAVLGGGPGGYPAALKAAQLGAKVALIEGKELGGTCLNRGCIPSKTLIAGAELLNRLKEAKTFGISVGEVSFDFSQLMRHKNLVIKKVRKGLENLISSQKIDWIKGFGTFTAPDKIKVQGKNNLFIRAKKIIIAAGSEPKEMKAFPFDYETIHDSTSLLEIETLPKDLIIIGGGVIGCEFASLFAPFGVKITILEMLPSLIPRECSSVSTALTKAFQKKGIEIQTSVKVEGIEKREGKAVVKLAGGKEYSAEMALVSVGRERNSSSLQLTKAGIAEDAQGLIPVDETMETEVPGIYAVGDISSNWWLAHVASHQGIVAGSNACGKPARMHYHSIPSVIFTDPEIATVGLSLEQALEQGYRATIGSFPFQFLGKSQATRQTEGFAQVVTDKESGQILGAQVVGHEASNLIAEMGVAIANELTLECITDTVHAHPTIAEAWLEAALVANETPLHVPPKRSAGKK